MNLPGQGRVWNHPSTDRSLVAPALTEAVRDGAVSRSGLDRPPSPTTAGAEPSPPARLPLTIRQRQALKRLR